MIRRRFTLLVKDRAFSMGDYLSLSSIEMETKLKQFWERGYMTFSNIISNSEAETVLNDGSKLSYVPIFKEVFGDMDRFRLMGNFSNRKRSSFVKLRNRVCEFVASFDNMKWIPKTWVILKSLEGGEEQAPHHDYPQFEISNARLHWKTTIQAGMIVAFMNNTNFIVYEGCFGGEVSISKKRELTLNQGDCIIFRGDLVHAGAAFTKLNYRMHVYLTVKDIPWNNNATEAALLKQYKCKFCDFMDSNRIKRNNHTRTCERRPIEKIHLDKITNKKRNTQHFDCIKCGNHYRSPSGFYKHKKLCNQQSNEVIDLTCDSALIVEPVVQDFSKIQE